MEFFPETVLSEAEAEVMARGMLAVARADGGMHVRESALIKSFYGEVVGGAGNALAALEAAPDLEPTLAASTLDRPEMKRLFLKSCLLLAFADGDFGAKERVLIGKYAEALSIDNAELGRLEQSVKEYLVGHLVRSVSPATAAIVAKELKV